MDVDLVEHQVFFIRVIRVEGEKEPLDIILKEWNNFCACRKPIVKMVEAERKLFEDTE